MSYPKFQCYRTEYGLFASAKACAEAGAETVTRIDVPMNKSELLPFINRLVSEAEARGRMAVDIVAPLRDADTDPARVVTCDNKEQWELEWEKLPYEIRLRAYCAAALG